MTDADWPTLDQVEAANVSQLLGWNATLPAPEGGTEHYTILARIVERLRGVQAEAVAKGAEVPQAGHAGWPS